MILRVPYDNLESTGIKAEIDGKQRSFLLQVQVNKTNIQEAISKLDSVKSVVAFEYTDESTDGLNVEVKTKPVLTIQPVSDLGIDFDFKVGQLPNSFRLVAELPMDYTDVRSVEDACTKHHNVRFVGGYLLRVEGVRLGLHSRSDIPKKIASTRIPLIWDGVKSYMKLVSYSELDETTLEHYDARREVVKIEKEVNVLKKPQQKKTTVKKVKPKQRVLASLGDLKGSGFDNF